MKPAVFVTGCTGSIGQAILASFKERGYFTIGTDISKKPEGYCDRFISLDLRDLGGKRSNEILSSLVSEIETYTKNLACLVNNAATQRLGGLESLSAEDWHESLNINLMAPIFLSKALCSILTKNNGVIINIGSIHSRLTKPGFLAYSVSKSALEGLTRALAVDLSGRIRVNGVTPAAVRTSMLEEGFKGNEEALSQLAAFHPSGIIGDPKEIGEAVAFLASPKTPFLNGSVIEISGGIGSRLHDPV